MPDIITPIKTNKQAICRDILHALPEWFALPQAIESYPRAVEELPMFGYITNGEIVGFLALKFQTSVAAEAYVLGVKQPWQRPLDPST
jgi:hypothetical protein